MGGGGGEFDGEYSRGVKRIVSGRLAFYLTRCAAR